jgi:hypothetical protein
MIPINWTICIVVMCCFHQMYFCRFNHTKNLRILSISRKENLFLLTIVNTDFTYNHPLPFQFCSISMAHLKRYESMYSQDFCAQQCLIFGSHGRQHVVGVHEDVHKGVQETKKGGVTSGNKLEAWPD